MLISVDQDSQEIQMPDSAASVPPKRSCSVPFSAAGLPEPVCACAAGRTVRPGGAAAILLPARRCLSSGAVGGAVRRRRRGAPARAERDAQSAPPHAAGHVGDGCW